MTGGTLYLPDEAATAEFGRKLAALTGGCGLITLEGDLGSGKTTLSRALIRALGHAGPVKSPTYTLVETYEIGDLRVLHYDLYRLNDPEELHYLGVRDFLDDVTLTLVEWPERGRPWLPAADLALELHLRGSGRQINWQAGTPRGQAWESQLSQSSSNFF